MFKETREFFEFKSSVSWVSITSILFFSSQLKSNLEINPLIKIILLWEKLLTRIDWSNSPGFVSLLKNFNSLILDVIIWLKSENFQSSIRLLGKPFLINSLRFFFLTLISFFEGFKFWITLSKSIYNCSSI